MLAFVGLLPAFLSVAVAQDGPILQSITGGYIPKPSNPGYGMGGSGNDLTAAGLLNSLRKMQGALNSGLVGAVADDWIAGALIGSTLCRNNPGACQQAANEVLNNFQNGRFGPFLVNGGGNGGYPGGNGGGYPGGGGNGGGMGPGGYPGGLGGHGGGGYGGGMMPLKPLKDASGPIFQSIKN